MSDRETNLAKLASIDGGKEDLADLLKRVEQKLKSGDGGGTYDGMEARVARLEASTTHIERDVSELRSDMKEVRDRTLRLEGKIDHLDQRIDHLDQKIGLLPGKGYIVTALLTTLAVIAGLIAFQQQIQSFTTRPAASVEAPK
jgi:hypothetical protein